MGAATAMIRKRLPPKRFLMRRIQANLGERSRQDGIEVSDFVAGLVDFAVFEKSTDESPKLNLSDPDDVKLGSGSLGRCLGFDDLQLHDVPQRLERE